MNIEHIAIWSKDIEALRRFYDKYFDVKSSEKYTNSAKKFSSYFLSFESGARLEIMQMETVKESAHLPGDHYLGYAHFAVTVGTKERVDDLITLLKRDCYKVLDGPRMTGDGFYEAAVLDPEGNRLEITE